MGEETGLKSWRSYIVFSCAIIFFWSISLRTVFYSLAPLMARDFGWNETTSGAAVGVFLGAYSLGQWLAGVLRCETRRTILVGITLALVAGLAVVLHSSPLMLFAVAPWMSFGVGVYFPKGMHLLTTAAPRGAVGRYISYHEMAASLAAIAGASYVGWFSLLWPWPVTLFAWCLFGLLPLWLFGRLRPTHIKDSLPEETAPVALDSFFFLTAALGGCAISLAMGLVSVLPLALVKFWQMSPAGAARLLGLTRIGAIPTPFLVGWASDHLGRVRILSFSLSLCAVVLLALPILPTGWVLALCLAMLALVVSGVMPVFFSFVADHYRRNAGAAAGMIGGIASLVGAGVAPAIFGYLLDHFAAGTVFGAAAFVTLIGLGALILAARKALPRL